MDYREMHRLENMRVEVELTRQRKSRGKPLPCPFCGSNPSIENGRNDRPWIIECINDDCPAQPVIDDGDTRFGVIAKWNTRNPIDSTS